MVNPKVSSPYWSAILRCSERTDYCRAGLECAPVVCWLWILPTTGWFELTIPNILHTPTYVILKTNRLTEIISSLNSWALVVRFDCGFDLPFSLVWRGWLVWSNDRCSDHNWLGLVGGCQGAQTFSLPFQCVSKMYHCGYCRV